MAHLGSTDTPIKVERLELPSGAVVETDGDDTVIKDTTGDVLVLFDDADGALVADEARLDVLEAASGAFDGRIDIPTYDDPDDAPNGTQFFDPSDTKSKYKDENGDVFATEARSDEEISRVAASYSEGLFPELLG